MKRLTERDTNGTAMAACCGENCKHNFCCENGGFAECEDMDDLIDRLAAIEDILGDEYDLERLQELVKADREGKIHPKYTIGETIYDRFGEFWTVDTVELHSLYTKNEWLYRCGHDGTYDYCALWEFESFPSKEAALRREQE